MAGPTEGHMARIRRMPAEGGGELECFMQEAGGTQYYVERRGAGPIVVLVPSGQGDCGAYKFLAERLVPDFTVITFELPGFSRSGPPPTWEGISASMLGDQTAAIVRALGIERATFFGSSSGGVAVLAVLADHPDLVQSVVAHEPAVICDFPRSPYGPPFEAFFQRIFADRAAQFGGIEEEERAALSSEHDLLFGNMDSTRALGEGHLERRIRNKPTWVKHYLEPNIPIGQRKFTRAEMASAPVTITIGLFTMGWGVAGALNLAQRIGAETVFFPDKHSPYVSNPDWVADVIRKSAAR